MSDIPNYAPQGILERIKAALAGLIPGGLPDTGVGPPLRGRPVSSGNVSDGFFGGSDNVIPPSRPDMTLGDPGFDLVSRIIQEVRNEATKGPSARTRGPQGGRGAALPAKVPPSKVGTKNVPIPVTPPSVDIAKTTLPPSTPSPGGNPVLDMQEKLIRAQLAAGQLSPAVAAQQLASIAATRAATAGGGGGDAQAAPAFDAAKYLFTPPPANFTGAAPSVNGPPIPPAGPDMGPPRGGPPPPMLSPGAPEVTAGLPPAPAAPPMASPMAMPPPVDPRAAGQGTLGPEFLAGMPPQMIAALLGLGRGRQ
ncbi:MAG TPA: hypothetical protein VNS88_15870 [Nitrospiraceae bacterium]|nr:hypothetical protein [Nitrospiraceae bacterium]